MREHRGLPSPSTPFGRFAGALSGLLLAACSGAAAPTPVASAPTNVAPAPVTGAPAQEAQPPAPRFVADAVVVDFRQPEREAALAGLLPRLSERIDAFFAADKPPSLAVAVIADGQVRLSRVLGWADVATQVAATSRTLYRIGSITKTFTTALVLSLRDEGKLELDVPAERYWPELAGVAYPFPDAARITLRHLLTHTSGLPRLGNFDYSKPDSQVTDAVLLAALAEAQLDAAPGTQYVYSNFGMSLVGFFAGRMSSEGSLRAALAQRVTLPLGMPSTTFDPASLPGAALATPYADSTSLAVAPLWNLGASEAAGGLWSSLDDMARWVAFQLSAWPPRPAAEAGPLRRATLREQHTGSFPIALAASLDGKKASASASSIGLGWHTQRSCELEHLVDHGGAVDGFRATVAFAPERGFGLVVLTNAVNARVAPLQDELVKLAAASLAARERRPAPALVAALDAFGASLESCPPSAYEALFDRGFRGAINAEGYAAVCASLSRRHGRCQLGETLSLSTASSGNFMLRCERGALRANATVHPEDGQTRFGGLLVRSTGFPASPALAKAAAAALKLHERWDDRGFSAAFADPGKRDLFRSGFAQIEGELGRCKLAADALTGPYGDGERAASFPIACERGGARNLDISIDANGKLTGLSVHEPEGKPQGCD